jgi:hypothetical protein
MKMVRLSGLLLVAVVALGLVAVSSAFAAGENPLFKPANGQSVTGTGGLSILTTGVLKVDCAKNVIVSGSVANSLLIGGVVIHYLECKYTSGEETSGCTAKSVGGGEGLILTTTLHGILGLLLPTKQTAVLFLPQSGKVFTTFALAEKEKLICGPETKVTGNVNAVVEPTGSSQLTGKVIVTTLKDIDLTHGLGLVSANLVAFSQNSTLEQSDSVTFGEKTEVT